MDRQQLLAASWSHVSALYSRELATRFQPWVKHCIQEILRFRLPEGNIIVPCCGSGQELVHLYQSLPSKRKIIGIDLSPGMVEMAQQTIRAAGCQADVAARVGDAMALNQDLSLQPVAAVMSIFGLQQLQPAPAQVLADWVSMLQPGGIAAVCYWPAVVESSGPWATYGEVLEEKMGRASAHGGDWEEGVPQQALQQGADLLLDQRVQHSMAWPDMHQFWQVMTDGGPWHARKLQFGDEFMEGVRRRFMGRYPEAQHGQQLVHSPAARLVLLQKGTVEGGDVRSCL